MSDDSISNHRRHGRFGLRAGVALGQSRPESVYRLALGGARRQGRGRNARELPVRNRKCKDMANAEAIHHAWIVVIAVPFVAQAETLAS